MSFRAIFIAVVLTLSPCVSMAEPPKSDTREADANTLFNALSAEKQRLLIKHAPRYTKATDGHLYLAQVEEEQNKIAVKPAAAQTERDRTILDRESPALYSPTSKKWYESRDDLHSDICDKVRAEWQAKVAATKQAELDKVEGEYILTIEVVQVMPDGLLVRLEKVDGKDSRLVRLDKYALSKVVVDGDRLRAEMKAKIVGRYQYTSTVGATRTIERYEVVKQFDWDKLLPKLVLPERSFTSVKPAELALTAFEEGWDGLPEWTMKKVKLSDGKSGGEVLGQRDNGWTTQRHVIRREKAEAPTYMWQWELKILPLNAN